MKITHLISALMVSFAIAATAANPKMRSLSGHIPSVVSRLKPVKLLPATNRMNLVIGLPLRNKTALTNLLADLYNPASTNFHHWLTSQEFSEKFGTTEEDYQKVIHFAETHGLKITATTPNRMLLDVAAQATSVEKAFQVELRVYHHPTENRTFLRQMPHRRWKHRRQQLDFDADQRLDVLQNCRTMMS